MDTNLNIQELLNIENLPGMVDGGDVVVYEKLELIPVESHPGDRKEDLESDYTMARKNIHFMNQMIMDMAEIALHNAKNSESPRHVETFAGLMSQLNTSAMSLMKLHKEMREITEEKTTTNPGKGNSEPNMNIENATVFVGSPTELMQQMGSSYEPKRNEFIDGEVEEVVDDGTGTGSE